MKRCPNCKLSLLEDTVLDNGMPAHRCSRCEGVWISSNPYLAWLRGLPLTDGPQATEEFDTPVWDTQDLKLCADCGRILSRYRVVPGAQFFVDHCNHCNGTWFDRGEWAAVYVRGLQTKINSFFTQPWQSQVRAEETRRVFEQLYADKFGATDYARIREIDAWLRAHPLRSMLLAYLQADDPYTA